MKEIRLLREKKTSSVFVSTCSNAVRETMNTHATAGHVTSFAWNRNTSRFSSIAGMIAPHVDLHDRSRLRWNMNHFRQKARGCLTTPVELPAADAAMAIVLDGHLCIWSWPVTMHDDQGPVDKEGRDGGSLKLLTWPFGRWKIDSSLPLSTACFGGCSPNIGERKLKNWNVLRGGRFGRSLLC